MAARSPENPTPDHQHSQPDAPIGRFILNKLNDFDTEMQKRYGGEYTSTDLMRSPDLLIEGLFWFNAYVVSRIPELAFIHIKALAEGFYGLATKPRHPKP